MWIDGKEEEEAIKSYFNIDNITEDVFLLLNPSNPKRVRVSNPVRIDQHTLSDTILAEVEKLRSGDQKFNAKKEYPSFVGKGRKKRSGDEDNLDDEL